MDFIGILKTVFNEFDQKGIRDVRVITNELKKNIQTEEDIVQYSQFKFLLELSEENFVYQIFTGHSIEDNLVMRLEEIITGFNDLQIAPSIYAYFIYVTLQALGIKSDRMSWNDPFINRLDNDTNSMLSKTFGFGLCKDTLEDYEIANNVIKRVNNLKKYTTIPYGVTNVDDGVISHNHVVEFITLPCSLLSMPSEMLASCPNLKTVLMCSDVKVIPQNFCSFNRNLSLVIANGVREIKAGAFEGTAINNIGFLGNNQLEIIGSEAFKDCDNIKRIDISNVKEVHLLAFANCRNITTVTMTISAGMVVNNHKFHSIFEHNKSDIKKYSELTEVKVKVPDGEIPESFFEDCINIQKIEIEGKISRIGAKAFKNCQNLRELIIDFDGFAIEEESFIGCRMLEKLPDFSGVQIIENNAFAGCNSIVELKFGTIKEIGKAVFQDCSNLRGIDINFAVDLLPDYSFAGCSSLIKYEFLNSVKRIGAFALSKMIFNENFTIPANIKGIQTNAFDSCLFEGILTIPKNCQINPAAFSNISKIDSIIYNNLEIRDLNNVKILPYMIFESRLEVFNNTFKELVNLYINTTKIEESAFKGWSNLQRVVIDGDFAEIPFACFEDCTNLNSVEINLEKFQVRSHAFANCINLTRLKTKQNKISFVSENVIDLSLAAKVEPNSFNNCTAIDQVCITINEQGIVDNFKLHSIFEEIREDIEGEYPNLKVAILNLETTKVPNFFFDACQNIETVKIIGNLEVLSEGFFRDCTKLAFIDMNYVGSVIPSQCFKNCLSLRNLSPFSYVEHIGNEAFFGCESLEEIQIECGVVTLGKSSFENCYTLKKLDMVFRGELLPEKCFLNCNSVLSFRFLNSITRIQSYALSNITFTEDFAVPPKLDYIESYAFANSTFLDTIVLPNAKIISHLAFVNVKGFDKIEFHNLKLKDTQNIEILPYKIFTDTLREFNEKYNDVETIIIKTNNIIDDAFKDWAHVTDVVISPAVKMLPNSCFEGCVSLEKIKLPYYDIALGNKVFTNCQNLVDVSFTDIDTKIETQEFVPLGTYNNCTKLESISISIDQTVIASKLKLYSFFEDNLEDFNVKYKKLNTVIIRSRVQELPESFFEGCINVEKIVILDEIDTLNRNVFANASNLQELKMKFTGEVIPAATFLGCERLPIITNLKSVKIIEEQAFERCYSISVIQFRTPIEFLGAKAFNQCINLEKINMYYTGEKLPLLCFGYCEALLTTPHLLRIVYADNSAFEGCINLDRVRINAINGAIFSNIFGSSKRITKINFTSDHIPARFFSDLRGIEELVFEKRVLSIGDSAFDGMKGLSTIKNIESVESIGDYAFAHSDIEVIRISTKTKYMGVGLFAGCEKLRRIVMPLRFMYAGSLFDSLSQNSTKKITQTYNNVKKEFFIPEVLEEIVITDGILPPAVFSGMDISIHVDNDVDEISDYAFQGCKAISFAAPEKIKKIGTCAFANSTLTELEFPNVQSIGEYAFTNSSIPTLSIGDKLTSMKATSLKDTAINKLLVAQTENFLIFNEMVVEVKKGIIIHVNNVAGDIIIPEEVHTIKTNTFVGCENLLRVTTNKVKTIETDAFVDCINLNTFKLEAAAETIHPQIFNNCPQINSLILDFLGKTRKEPNEIGYLFKELTTNFTFENVAISSGLVCNEPFINCEYIANLDLQKIGIKEMGVGLFKNLGIGTLTIPDATEKIKDFAFNTTFIEKVINKNNTKVKIVDDCIYVEKDLVYCFVRDSQKIIIPQNIMNIRSASFHICNSIEYLEIDNDLIKFNDALQDITVINELSLGKIKDEIKEVFKTSLKTVEKFTYKSEIIKDNFFDGITTLKELSFPNINELTPSCLCDETKLVVDLVTIGSKLTSIDAEFLRSMDVNNILLENNQLYITHNNMLIDNRKTAIIYASNNIDSLIDIDFNVTKIAEKAFINSNVLRRINTGPVQEIGNQAFFGCNDLRDVVVENVCQSIGEDIFKKCPRLENISVPFVGSDKDNTTNVSYIVDTDRRTPINMIAITNQEVIDGTFAFSKNILKVMIGEATRKIKARSFENLQDLREVGMPKRLESIDEFVFLNCKRKVIVHVNSKKTVEMWPKSWRKVTDRKLFAKTKVSYGTQMSTEKIVLK